MVDDLIEMTFIHVMLKIIYKISKKNFFSMNNVINDHYTQQVPVLSNLFVPLSACKGQV